MLGFCIIQTSNQSDKFGRIAVRRTVQLGSLFHNLSRLVLASLSGNLGERENCILYRYYLGTTYHRLSGGEDHHGCPPSHLQHNPSTRLNC